MQAELDFSKPRAVGALAEAAVACKAARTAGFDLDAARAMAVTWLRDHGPSGGESIVNALKHFGFEAHDDRAYGAVFSALSRRKLIRCVGYCARAKGHGTAGGRIWEAV